MSNIESQHQMIKDKTMFYKETSADIEAKWTDKHSLGEDVSSCFQSFLNVEKILKHVIVEGTLHIQPEQSGCIKVHNWWLHWVWMLTGKWGLPVPDNMGFGRSQFNYRDEEIISHWPHEKTSG